MELKSISPETTFFKGGKRGIILFHAYTGTPNDVRLLGRFLNKQGYSVLLPLFSGHGTTRPEDILSVGPSKWHEDLAMSVNWMVAQGYEQLAVFGLSLGGVLALRGLEDYPEIVIGGGPFCSPIVPDSQTNIIPAFLNYVKTIKKRSGMTPEKVKAELPNIEQALLSQLLEIEEFATEVYQKLPEVEQPVVLVQAGLDKMIDPATVYKVAEQLGRGTVSIKHYPESGHVVTVGPERQELQEDILDFVRTLTWQAKE